VTAWAPRRFWTAVSVIGDAGGYAIRLDDRPVRTPAKAPLLLPTRALADAIAAEWQAQSAAIDTRTMPLTRAANSAVDKVTAQFDDVAGLVAAYGASDLLCYRAAAPAELVARQATAWDPLLDWAAETLAARLTVTTGVAPVPQPPAATASLTACVAAQTPFALTALADLTALSGSLVIGLAARHGPWVPAELWDASRIDEEWQAAQWGRDDEADAAADAKRRDFLQAHLFWQLSTPV
jgi:chaperone required for assembly of F1-ATPase